MPQLHQWRRRFADMNFPIELITDCAEMTENVGRELATELQNNTILPRFVAMYGDLGVGKTAFVRGFCSEICPSSTVKSPTFALVNDYRASGAAGGIKRVYHFDMYRISGWDDLYTTGYFEALDSNGVVIVEWSENIESALPEHYISITIENISENERRVIVEEV